MKMFLEAHRYSKGVDLVNQLTVAVAIPEKKKQGGKEFTPGNSRQNKALTIETPQNCVKPLRNFKA